jgi:hypothetical protein
MTCSARLGILALECRGVETRPVGVEPPATLCRMASEAVTLGMARDTALEVLPSSLPVSQHEGPFGVMIPGVERSTCREAGVHVALGTELTRIMAVATARLSRISRRRVPPKEAGRMIARRRVGGIWPVTVETLGPDMAAVTRLGARIGNRPMLLGEIRSVRGRPFSYNHRASAAPRSGSR